MTTFHEKKSLLYLSVWVICIAIKGVDMENVTEGRYLSADGNDVSLCGTPSIPCKSLKYMMRQRKPLSRENTIYVIHVEGTFMACENVIVRENLKLIGINGRPIFNCNQNCGTIFIDYLSQTTGKITKPNVLLRNLEVINTGCNTSMIYIVSTNWVELDNIIFKESVSPAISVFQQNRQPMNITVRNSYFLSAFGIQVNKFTSLFLTIDKSQFIGKGDTAVKGINVNYYVRNDSYKDALGLVIKSSSFRYLPGAITVITADDNFYMIIENSSFILNYFIQYKLPFYMLRDQKPGGAITLLINPSKVQKQAFIRFNNVVFRNNTSISGGAVLINSNKKSGRYLRIIFDECQFIGNEAFSGGAITVNHPGSSYYQKIVVGIVYLFNCVFENNKAIKLKDVANHLKYNDRVIGGGVACGNFEIHLVNTTMINNYAYSRGGSISDIGCIINLRRTTIRIDEGMLQLPHNGQAIYARGHYKMSYVRIEMNKPANIQNSISSYIWITSFRSGVPTVPYVVPHQVDLICSRGNDIDLNVDLMTTRPLENPHLNLIRNINNVRFRCLSCPQQFYSLDYGRAILLNVSFREIHNIKCVRCPYGGNCSSSRIKAKANFWGYRSQHGSVYTIKFLPCLTEYCCQGENCETFNSCNKNREGILCGQCRKGYVQGLSTSKCIKVSKCGNPMIWPLIIILGVVYLLFLIYLSDIAGYLKGPFCGEKMKTSNNDNDNQIQETFIFTSFVKVIFFFYQIEPLIMIRVDKNVSHTNHFLHMVKSLRSFYTEILNFQIRISCPFKFVSPVINRVLSGAFPILLLILLGVLCICCSIITLYKRSLMKTNEHQSSNTAPTAPAFKARLVSCLVNLILLSYATITKTTLALLNCTKIHQIQVLYLDGAIICYNNWQYVLMVFAVVFILPLSVGLDSMTRKLKRRKLTVPQFLILLFFPILSILSTITSCIRSFIIRQKNRYIYKKINNEENLNIEPLLEPNQAVMESVSSLESVSCAQESGTLSMESEQMHEATDTLDIPQSTSLTNDHDYTPKHKEGLLEAVLKVIDRPYSKEQGKDKINWESILIARRLIMILIFTFVPYPTLRIVLMLIMCLLMIVHTAYANPYLSNFVNKCEMISLFILVLLCIINILVGFSYESNSRLIGYLMYFPDVFNWIEVILVDVIPAIMLFAIVVVIILRLVLLIWKGIRFLALKCQKACL